MEWGYIMKWGREEGATIHKAPAHLLGICALETKQAEQAFPKKVQIIYFEKKRRF